MSVSSNEKKDLLHNQHEVSCPQSSFDASSIFGLDKYSSLAMKLESLPDQNLSDRMLIVFSKLFRESDHFIKMAESLSELKAFIYYGRGMPPVTSIPLKGQQERCRDFELLRLTHGIIGAMSEAGELGEVLVRVFVKGESLDDIPFPKDLKHAGKTNRDFIIEECGDLLWYINLVMCVIGEPLVYLPSLNISKLHQRYKEGKFSAADANHRDLAAEFEATMRNVNGDIDL